MITTLRDPHLIDTVKRHSLSAYGGLAGFFVCWIMGRFGNDQAHTNVIVFLGWPAAVMRLKTV
jgi:hypothetical protein